jgi:proteasome accessory factor C
MPEHRGPDDASSRLERLLYVLPAACRDSGVPISELAEQLDVSEQTIVRDLGQVIERSYRLTAGSAGNLQITLTGTHVTVWTPDAFARPVRLSMREALALGIGLRMAALSPSGGEPDRREEIRRRLERHLASRPADTHLRHFGAPALESDPEGVRETLALCARDRRPCRIRYLKPGSAEGQERDVHPYVLVHAEGRWYLLGHCPAAEDVRAFRLDRIAAIVDVGSEADGFEPPADFEPAEHFDGARVFRAPEESVATVRYSAAVARAIAEQREGEHLDDGGYLVRHRVADPAWLVRHVLEWGGDAEVVEPPELRRLVGDAAERVAARHAAG